MLIISWWAITDMIHYQLDDDGQGAKSRMHYVFAVDVFCPVLSLDVSQTAATQILFDYDVDCLPHRHPRVPNL